MHFVLRTCCSLFDLHVFSFGETQTQRTNWMHYLLSFLYQYWISSFGQIFTQSWDVDTGDQGQKGQEELRKERIVRKMRNCHNQHCNSTIKTNIVGLCQEKINVLIYYDSGLILRCLKSSLKSLKDEKNYCLSTSILDDAICGPGNYFNPGSQVKNGKQTENNWKKFENCVFF